MKKLKTFHWVILSLIVAVALFSEGILNWIELNAPDLPLIVVSIALLLFFCKFYIDYHEDKRRARNE